MGKHEAGKAGDPAHDWFYDWFDKGLGLPRHPAVRCATFLVIFILLLAAVRIITGVF